jgi:hypothetical protein
MMLILATDLAPFAGTVGGGFLIGRRRMDSSKLTL